MNFKYNIQFKRKRSISIKIDRDATVTVFAPKYIPKSYIEKFILSKSEWIEKNIKKINASIKITEKKFKDGESFLYLGKEIQLLLSDEKFEGIKFDDKNFLLSKHNKKNPKEIFYKFYFLKAEEIITTRVSFYIEKYNFKINKIRISKANTRWGSCSIKKNINISWKLIMADINIIDYVIIHELAHTIEHNHSKNFWKIVEKIIPDYKEKRLWLKRNGMFLDIK